MLRSSIQVVQFVVTQLWFWLYAIRAKVVLISHAIHEMFMRFLDLVSFSCDSFNAFQRIVSIFLRMIFNFSYAEKSINSITPD